VGDNLNSIFTFDYTILQLLPGNECGESTCNSYCPSPTPTSSATPTLTPTITPTSTPLFEIVLENCCDQQQYVVFGDENTPVFDIGTTYYIIGQPGLVDGCYKHLESFGKSPTYLGLWSGNNDERYTDGDTCESCINDHPCPVVPPTPNPTSTPTPTTTPAVTPTRTVTPTVTRTPTRTPTPTCAGPGNFLTGNSCYQFKWNSPLLANSPTQACQNARGVNGEAFRSTNVWTSCCSYQQLIVPFGGANPPTGCLVYKDGDLVGNGWISDGCYTWQIENGAIVGGYTDCVPINLCCNTAPT
jgi:hypothetical protein